MCMTARKKAAQANTKRLGALTVANVQAGTVPALAKEADFKRQAGNTSWSNKVSGFATRSLVTIRDKKANEAKAAAEAARVEAERQAVLNEQSAAATANTRAIGERTVASELGATGPAGVVLAEAGPAVTNTAEQSGGSRKRKQQYGDQYNSGVSL